MRFQKDAGNKHFVGSGGGFGLGDIDDLAFRTVDNLIFGVGTSEKVRIASNGQVCIGEGFKSSGGGQLTIRGLGVNAYAVQDYQYIGTPSGADTTLSQIRFTANTTGNSVIQGARIQARSDAAWSGSGDAPTRLEFWTAPDGSATTYERLRITSAGNLKLPDSAKIELGGAQTGAGDLQIYHTAGADSWVKTTSGDLWLQSTADDVIVRAADNISLQVQGGEYGIDIAGNAAVKLFYDASVHTTAKLSTTATGVSVHGEVAATQDYPNYRPTLDFNFAAVKKLDPRIKYYRSGPASYVDEFGKLVLVGENAPRFDHDPATRESKGLLIEESRINILPYSTDVVGQSAWARAGVLTENTTATTAPDGSYDAVALRDDGSNGQHTLYDDVAVGNITSVYTSSCWAKAGSQSFAEIFVNGTGASGTVTIAYNFNLSTGAATYTGTGGFSSGTSATATEYPNGWWRLSVTADVADSASGSGTFRWHVRPRTSSNGNYQGDDSIGIYVWGLQLELGTFLTSYIPGSSTGGTATRGADIALIDGQDFTDAYNVPEGTFILNASNDDFTTSNQGTWGVEKSTNRSGYFINLGYRVGGGNSAGDIGAWYNNNGSTSAFHNMAVASTGVAVGVPYKTAFAYKVNDMASTTNGITVQTDTSAAITAAGEYDRFVLGSYHYDDMSTGHIQRVMYYTKRLSNTQLVTLTS